MKIYELGLDNLDTLVADLVSHFENGVVILKGDLASGKTTLVKKIVNNLGIEDDVTSPTFSLQQCYSDKTFHYDLYNHGIKHFISLGMLEELDRAGLHFVEWGDDALQKILDSAQISYIVIIIDKIKSDKRKYRVDYAHT